jgi:hypothetical protein
MSLGRICAFQVCPPSVVATTTPVTDDPTAQQSNVLGHDTAPRDGVPPGRICPFQDLPPSLLTATSPFPEFPAMPTAQQSDVVGHETPFGSIGSGFFF